MKKLLLILAVSFLNAQDVKIVQSVNENIQKTAPSARFEIDDIKGIVKDKYTELTWYRCPLGKTWNKINKTCDGTNKSVSFSDALKEVKKFNTDVNNKTGIKKWRLPNIKELYSLDEESANYPALNAKVFPNFMSVTALDDVQNIKNDLWSSTYHKIDNGVLIYSASQGTITTRTTGISEYEQASALMVSE